MENLVFDALGLAQSERRTVEAIGRRGAQSDPPIPELPEHEMLVLKERASTARSASRAAFQRVMDEMTKIAERRRALIGAHAQSVEQMRSLVDTLETPPALTGLLPGS